MLNCGFSCMGSSPISHQNKLNWVYGLKVKRTAHDGYDVGSIPARLNLIYLNFY